VEQKPARHRSERVIDLPLPRLKGRVSLEEALAWRRSIRDYTDDPIELWELAQILWAADGVSELTYGFRTAPSAGATYPYEIYVVVHPKGVRLPDGSYLEPGSYRYRIYTHQLEMVKPGDYSKPLYHAALEQEWVLKAKVNIVLAAVYERTTRRYGERGIRYVHIEAGHIGQNIYLQATALGLATVAIGAFYDDDVREIIGAPPNHHPIYIMPVARPAYTYRLDESKLHNYILSRRR
jgi:SagB-type dehydrogenase family enzyme